ncbi:MAG: hypothetical protein ALECFALPRED_001308 [Alectoria fallacina]|uniref:Uncharacterized protein n=1 Tax=Alectoria fallacina TaxID=1903189 RepID=A0A8H3IGD4_9LECA|nr:MAG: hypothetical protein ALECFALPRED_001308 [Alectoria fallacina]
MDESDSEPVSLPCSAPEAKIGLPVMVQLHLVDAVLKKNPQPREDFYRQYSVTPERRRPQEERTPPPPSYSPETILRKSKAWAATVAKSLKRFHAGRVMLRKEEAEQHGVLEEDPDYWESQAKDWQGELWRLMKEMGKRKVWELKGEAEEGYAMSMLLSPLQSLSPPPSNGSLLEVAQHSKVTTAISDELPETSTRSLQPHAGPSQGPLQLTPEHNPDCLPTSTKNQKRARIEFEGYEEESLEQSSRTKRQRRVTATARRKGELAPAIKSPQGLEKNMSKFSRTKTEEGAERKNLSPKAPLAQRTLPWKLRPRDVTAYREIGTGTTAKNRGPKGRKGKKKGCQRSPRLHGKCPIT